MALEDLDLPISEDAMLVYKAIFARLVGDINRIRSDDPAYAPLEFADAQRDSIIAQCHVFENTRFGVFQNILIFSLTHANTFPENGDQLEVFVQGLIGDADADFHA